MNTRAYAVFASGAAAVAAVAWLWLVPMGAQEKRVDRTGLDILCSKKGDVYSPPNKAGISTCLFGDGQVLVCDSKTDKCYSALAGEKDPGRATIVEGAMTLRLLKELHDKVDRLTSQLESQRRQER